MNRYLINHGFYKEEVFLQGEHLSFVRSIGKVVISKKVISLDNVLGFSLFPHEAFSPSGKSAGSPDHILNLKYFVKNKLKSINFYLNVADPAVGAILIKLKKLELENKRSNYRYYMLVLIILLTLLFSVGVALSKNYQNNFIMIPTLMILILFYELAERIYSGW